MTISAFPEDLTSKFKEWRSGQSDERKSARLDRAVKGQKPHALVIACADSRVKSTEFFGADEGDFFMHRNIANFVPPYSPDGGVHGTSAVLEFGIEALEIPRILVLGHTLCGGIAGCHAMCSSPKEEEEPKGFLSAWLDVMRPAYDKVAAKGGNNEEQVANLEREAILTSLSNLMEYPFVAERVAKGSLTLHGAIYDIKTASLDTYDPAIGTFVAAT